MADSPDPVLVLLTELEGLSDAHLIGTALDEQGIAYRVARHDSHAFDIAIPHGWGMLYVDQTRTAEAMQVVEDVRSDEEMLEDAEEAAEAEDDEEDED